MAYTDLLGIVAAATVEGSQIFKRSNNYLGGTFS